MRVRCVRLGITLAAVVAAQAVGLAQGRTSQKAPGKGDAVVAKGCLSGPMLQSVETVATDQTGRVDRPLTYQLKGDKSLLKRLREEHNGKVVDITGVLKSNLPQDSSIGGKTMGKTKVTFGISTPSAQKGAPESQPSLPVLEVKSYDGSGARCGR